MRRHLVIEAALAQPVLTAGRPGGGDHASDEPAIVAGRRGPNHQIAK
jgi:hypothetical protein